MTTATASPAIREIAPNVWKAQSKSHPNAAHTVRRVAEGFSCTCPATRKCWHIKEIEAMSKPEPTFIPVSDPVDDDPFADMDEPTLAPVEKWPSRPTHCQKIHCEKPTEWGSDFCEPHLTAYVIEHGPAHKPSMAEVVDFFCN